MFAQFVAIIYSVIVYQLRVCFRIATGRSLKYKQSAYCCIMPRDQHQPRVTHTTLVVARVVTSPSTQGLTDSSKDVHLVLVRLTTVATLMAVTTDRLTTVVMPATIITVSSKAVHLTMDRLTTVVRPATIRTGSRSRTGKLGLCTTRHW